MQKVDPRKQLKHLYNPTGREVSVVDVPPMNFLMIDGKGDPNTSEDYAHAVEALYAVMPLEGLWWADDMTRFSGDDKDAWRWTAMIMQPEFVTEALVQEAKSQVEEKKGPLPALSKMRFELFHEGRAAQIMYHGPYSEEGPTIQMLHEFIAERGRELGGKHHEIYLGDPRRAAPERLKTVIRQPFG